MGVNQKHTMTTKSKKSNIIKMGTELNNICSKIYGWDNFEKTGFKVPNGHARVCFLHKAWHLRAGRDGDCWISYEEFSENVYGDIIIVDLPDGSYKTFPGLNAKFIRVIALMMAKRPEIMGYALASGTDDKFYQMIVDACTQYEEEQGKLGNVIRLHQGKRVIILKADDDEA